MSPDARRWCSARLEARALCGDDRADLARVHRDPRVMAMLGGVCDAVASGERLAAYEGQWATRGFGAWALRDGDGFAGYAALDLVEHQGRDEAELLCAILPDRWGLGYGLEASRAMVELGLGPLGLPSILGRFVAECRGSQRIVETLGFAYEGYVAPRLIYRLARGG